MTATGMKDQSISVIVTAMNEQGNIEPTVTSVVNALRPRFARYEVIIVDDGSSDETPSIVARLASMNPCIRVHRNARNLGLGRTYRIGIGLARYEHTGWVAGNNLVPQEALERIYDRVGERDMVISYVLRDVRGWERRFMSRAFTVTMNLLFSVRMRYYTGPCVFNSAIAKTLPGRAHGSLYVAELLVRLLLVPQTYVEIGLQPQPRSSGATKTFRLKNVLDVAASVLQLCWELRVSRGHRAVGRDASVPDNEPIARSR